MADEVDFEPEYEEEQPMDDVVGDGAGDGGAAQGGGDDEDDDVGNGGAAAAQGGGKGRKGGTKGRGHQNTSMEVEDRYDTYDMIHLYEFERTNFVATCI